MKTSQVRITASSKFENEVAKVKAINPQMVLMFGSREAFTDLGWVKKASEHFKGATMIGCSTAGEIYSDGFSEGSLVLTGVHFDHPSLRTATAKVTSMEASHQSGKELGATLKAKDLKAIFVLGRGLNINGSALVEGIRESVGAAVAITGGLAGDAGRFQETYTIMNGDIQNDCVVAIGICGEDLQVSHGSQGGWKSFGPVRRVTKSKANVLFEIDGQPALDIYKKYLGDKAAGLPSSGLLYPFALLKDNQDTMGLIRTILAVNEEEKSMTFAGDIPTNGLVRLMHANNEGLVEGAKSAAEHAFPKATHEADEALGILISCVGRKIVMGPDVEDEIDAVRDVFGDSPLTGFYSYGEICPQGSEAGAKLHNQTMTITYLYEKKAA